MTPNILTRTSAAFLAVASLAATAPSVRADDAADLAALKAEIQALEQKVETLEQKQAAAAAATPPPAAEPAPAPGTQVTLDGTGLRVVAANGTGAFHLGALVQFDAREFFDDNGGSSTFDNNNSFVLRRARLIADGTLNRIYSFQFVPEFGGTSAVSVYDANIGIAPTDEVQFKFGKFKAPVGLEQLQQDAYTFFTERSLATNLVPNRDLGAQVGGGLFGGRVSYAVGAFNGVADAANTTNQDFDNDKDVDGRIFIQPFAADKGSFIQGLGAGVAASFGHENGLASAGTAGAGTASTSVTGGYKTDGQQTFFSYSKGVYADGRVTRLTPQAYWYAGPFGLLGEYVESSNNVRIITSSTTPLTRLENKAWDVQAGWVLTGENATYNGVVPDHPFDWNGGTWGAWQVVLRYEDLKIDPNTFPTFASTSTNAKEAAAVGGGLNWYLSRAVRISTDFFDTKFTLPTAALSSEANIPNLNHNEKAVDSRVQFFF